LPDGRVRLTNQSRKVPLHFLDGSELGPTCSQDVALPVTLHIAHRAVSIESSNVASAHLESLADVPLPPGAGSAEQSLFGTVAAAGMQGESLLRWLQAAMDVLQSAASSLDFFD